MSILEEVGAGVITGDKVIKVFEHAQAHGYAIPAINVTSSSTANAAMEAAKGLNSPIILQVSNGGSAFFAGKGISNTNQAAAVAGAVAGALHIRAMAKHYGIPVILHSDHCAKKLLPWFDGMLEADKEHFRTHGEPLFSSHMLDLSEEIDPENIETCVRYMKEMKEINCFLEMEIGITGGEEDGVNNENVDADKLYTQPEQVFAVYEALTAVAPKMFSIAAAFGNVHGVYKPGNVKLNPGILGKHQAYIAEKIGVQGKPVFLVMHGGSGSTAGEIAEAVSNGIVKMNVDTDTQWAYWSGIKDFYEAKKGYLQGQIGNPDGPEKPNKKFYDPRVWVREAEKTMNARVVEACERLNNVGTLALKAS